MIIIKEWYGRLGNNIMQLSNVIDIALFYKHNICFKTKHKFFDIKIIENYFNKYKNNEIIKDKHNFFFKWKLPFPKEVFKPHNKIKIDLLKQVFLIKDKDINKLNEKNVVIHIRSGDLFNKKPHPAYVPPPLAYFVKILNKNVYKKL